MLERFDINGAIIEFPEDKVRYNAIRIEFNSDRSFTIYVDESIAPYMPYTNEPWMAKKWNGKPNPNEGWWEKVVEICALYIANRYKGEIK